MARSITKNGVNDALIASLPFLLLALLIGCADEGAKAGTQAATECARSDLIAQCPVNTVPRLEIDGG